MEIRKGKPPEVCIAIFSNENSRSKGDWLKNLEIELRANEIESL